MLFVTSKIKQKNAVYFFHYPKTFSIENCRCHSSVIYISSVRRSSITAISEMLFAKSIGLGEYVGRRTIETFQ